MSIFSHLSRSFGKKVAPKGFTLVELLAVISIMLVLTSFFILRQNQFNSSTIFRSLAYSIALSIRQAQVYGTSLRSADALTFTTDRYGVNVSVPATPSTPITTYTLFADVVKDGLYDGSNTSEFVQEFKLNQGFTIRKFCAVLGSAQSCNTETTGGGSPITRLNVFFERPNLDAQFCTAAGSCNYTEAYVQIEATTGDLRNITVYSTGQISVCTLNEVYPAC
jgi:prepilin-type N-terminal cleavage/methylation domain-containing protein